MLRAVSWRVAPIRAAGPLLNVSESCSWWSLSGPHSVIRCVLLPAFGTFWIGEGLGLTWPGENWCIVGLIAGFLCGTDRCANCPGVTCNTKPRHIARCRMNWIKTIFCWTDRAIHRSWKLCHCNSCVARPGLVRAATRATTARVAGTSFVCGPLGDTVGERAGGCPSPLTTPPA
jgi:hypothetical protein